jgi:hypothetical protein
MQNGHWPRPDGGGANDLLAYLKASHEIDSLQRAQITDKWTAKAFIEQRLGAGWAVPTLGILQSSREVQNYAFPQRCVIKPTHLSGQIIYRRKGESLELEVIRRWFRMSHYLRSRERNYRQLTPRVIVEPWLDLEEQREYKIYCVNGEPRVLTLIQDLTDRRPTCRAFDMQGQPQDFLLSGPGGWGKRELAQIIPIPQLEVMAQICRKLAAGTSFLRVDLYQSQGQVWVGELSSVPMNGAIWVSPRTHQNSFDQMMFGLGGFNLADFPELAPAYPSGS